MTLFSRNIHKIKDKENFSLLALFGVGILYFALLLLFAIRIEGSDDTVFITQIQPYDSVYEWIIYRYQNWSGRIFAESFVYLFSSSLLITWKLVNLGIYAAFVGILYLYYKTFTRNTSAKQNQLMLALAVLLPFLLNSDILFASSLWMTGSMNYLWPATLGLIGFYPIAYTAIRKHLPGRIVILLLPLAALVAAASQEQVGAVLAALSVIFTGYIFFTTKSKATAIYPTIITLGIGAFFLMSILAPGNALRLEAEIIRWLPDFYTTPFLERAEYGIRWFFDALINRMGLLLIGVWVCLVSLFVKKNTKNILDWCFIAILLLSSIILVAKGFTSLPFLYEFHATWKSAEISDFSYLIFIPWGAALIATIAAPIALYRNKVKGYLLALLGLAALASLAIITLSPTMYASDVRTLFIPSLLFLITGFVLLEEIFTVYKRSTFLLIGLAGLGIYHGILALRFFY